MFRQLLSCSCPSVCLIGLRTTVESCRADVGKVLRETLELGVDLVRKLVGVANADCQRLVLHGRTLVFGQGGELLEGGDDKDSGLAHTSLGLAQHIQSKDGAGDALVLDSGRVLESTVRDGTQELGLEHEVLKASIVDVGVVALGCGLLLLLCLLVLGLLLAVVGELCVGGRHG